MGTDSQATTQLNTQFYKNSQCIPGLYQIAVSSDNQAVCLFILHEAVRD
jgi:hypothetical protein